MLADGEILAEQSSPGGRDRAAALAPLVASALAQAGVAAGQLACIAVTVGPGSFTGLRASLALAHGLALATGRPAVAVTVAEALALQAGPVPGRRVWTVIDNRRGRVFLDIDGVLTVAALAALPATGGPVAVVGDAAPVVAAWLAARGDDVMLTAARQQRAADVARVGSRRLAGGLPPLAAQPIYVDPPEAKLPQGGLRPPPVGVTTGWR